MALELTELQAVTDDYWEKTPIDIFFDDSVLLYMLMSGSKFTESMVTPGELVDGGEKIRVLLEIAGSHSGTYGNTTKIPQSRKEIMNAARFGWAGYFSSNTIDLDEQIKNNGKAAIVDLAFMKLRNIQKTIRDKMGTDVYASAADSNALLGLGNLFNTSTSTAYGTVKEADVSDWKANVITEAQTIGLPVMQAIRRTASVGQNKESKPDLYITTDILKDGFERTLTPQQRYASDTKLANVGFDNVLFGMNPIVADDKQTAGYLDALNLRHLSMKTHSKYAFTKPKWEYSKEQPDTLTANVRWIGQLVTNNRKAHCRHNNLSAPA